MKSAVVAKSTSDGELTGELGALHLTEVQCVFPSASPPQC